MRVLLGMVMALGLGGQALAIDCDSLVASDAVIKGRPAISDIAKVEAAAKSLAATGVTIRVRAFNSLAGADSMDSYMKNTMARQCPSWASGDGWRSTLLVLAYAPNDRGQIGVYYGSSNQPRIGNGKWQDILRDRFVPRIRDFQAGDAGAITAGFVSTLNEFTGIFARPSVGGTVTVNQATDMSGLWKFMGWALLFVALCGGIWFGARIYMERDRRKSAQQEAKRLRSECIGTILFLNDPTELAILESIVTGAAKENQGQLKVMLAEYNRLAGAALATSMEFDPPNSRDPNEALMPVEAYKANSERYSQIVRDYIVPAKKLAADIRSGNIPEPEAKRSGRRRKTEDRYYDGVGKAQTTRTASQPPTSSSVEPTPSQSTTTVIHESAPSVVVIGSPYHDAYEYSRRRSSWDDDSSSRSTRSSRSDDDSSSRSSRSSDDDSSSRSSSRDSGGSFESSFSSSSSSSDSSSSWDSGGSYSSSDSGGSFDSSSSSSD